MSSRHLNLSQQREQVLHGDVVPQLPLAMAQLQCRVQGGDVVSCFPLFYFELLEPAGNDSTFVDGAEHGLGNRGCLTDELAIRSPSPDELSRQLTMFHGQIHRFFYWTLDDDGATYFEARFSRDGRSGSGDAENGRPLVSGHSGDLRQRLFDVHDVVERVHPEAAPEIGTRVRDALMQFDDAGDPIRYSLIAVLDDPGDEDEVRAWLVRMS